MTYPIPSQPPISQTPEVIAQRAALADDLQGVAKSLTKLLATWIDLGAEGDVLAQDEFPFTMALEELEAEVYGAVDLIRERNENNEPEAGEQTPFPLPEPPYFDEAGNEVEG